MRVIAFGHRKRVGKDTCAKFLISHLRMTQKGISVQMAGFADKLKGIAHDLYGHCGLMPGWWYDEPERAHLREVILPTLGKTPRQVWIDLGKAIRDRVYEATWYEYLLRRAKADILVVSDMRFPVEANGILDAGGQVYRVDRPGVGLDRDGADDQLLDFANWTGVIDNGGTLAELHSKVIAIADALV